MTIRKTALGFEITLEDAQGFPPKIALIKYGYEKRLTRYINLDDQISYGSTYTSYLYFLAKEGIVSKWLQK
jgi:hypothetical protein